jgi:AI-2 transport protein TqsA
MTLGSRDVAGWLVSAALLLGLLIVGKPLLVPLVFAVLLWGILNALTRELHSFKLPIWLCWIVSLLLISGAIYFVIQVMVNESAVLEERAPLYAKKLMQLVTEGLAFFRLGSLASLNELVSKSDAAGYLGVAAVSIGNFALGLTEIVIYVGFLLAEQKHLPAKFAQLRTSTAGQHERKQVFQAISHQVQTYLGVCTVMSGAMAGVTYALLAILGVDFAGVWALVMFLLTYIPTIGAVGVVFPALMALLQFGTVGAPLIILIVLSIAHFVLTNVVETVMLRRTLNLSPFAIIFSLTFWGLVWGAAGLFLAVPMTGAIAIICEHIDGLKWVAILVAAPRTRHHTH